MPASWYHERGGLSEHALFDALEDHTGQRLDRVAVTATARAVFQADLASVSEIHPVTAIARRYHRRLPLAVASAGPRVNVTAVLHVTGLAHLFDHVVTIDDVPVPKPAPDLFLEAARRLDIAPARCLAFEDSVQGLQAAAAAGMRVIDVATLIGSRAFRPWRGAGAEPRVVQNSLRGALPRTPPGSVDPGPD